MAVKGLRKVDVGLNANYMFYLRVDHTALSGHLSLFRKFSVLLQKNKISLLGEIAFLGYCLLIEASLHRVQKHVWYVMMSCDSVFGKLRTDI